MAIAYVASTTATAGPDTASNIANLTMNVPAGVSDNDLLLAFVALPRHEYYAVRGTSYIPQRRYAVSPPAGWFSGGNAETWAGFFDAEQGRVWMYWRVASSEPASYEFPVTQSTLDVEHEDDIAIVGTMVAYSGTSISQPIGTEVLRYQDTIFPNIGQLTVNYDNSLLVQAALGVATGDPNLGFSSLTERVEPNSATLNVAQRYDDDGTTPASSSNYQAEILVGDTAVATAGNESADSMTGSWDRRTFLLFALTDATEDNTDAPPAPGNPGTTGSGALIPETDIADPLITEIWGESAGSLTSLATGSDTPQVIGAQLALNGLGACVGGTVYFPADAGLSPFAQAIRLRVSWGSDEEYWYAALVENIADADGLTEATVKGLFAVLNESRISTSSSPFEVDLPTLTGLTAGTLNLNPGRDVGLEEGTTDEYITYSEYLNSAYAIYPDACWGIGPDLYYIQGRPQNGGVQTLDAESSDVLAVTPSDFILPEYATEWWAEDSTGTILDSSRSGVGLLTPRRLVSATVDSADALVTPASATLPYSTGPAYTLLYRGIAIPPLQVTNLPDGGAQYVASAQVDVNVGEAGRMPVVTTTLRTVALPYRRS